MNNENKPQSALEPRMSKLKKRRRPVSSSGASALRQRLGTILDVTNRTSTTQGVAASNNKQCGDTAVSISNNAQNVAADTSILGFINHMDEFELQSVMTLLIGDTKQFTYAEFEQAVSQAFGYRTKRQNTADAKVFSAKGFVLPLLGSVDLCVASGQTRRGPSLPFPLPHEIEKKPKEDRDQFNMRPFWGFEKLSGNGLLIPLTLCQFPCTKSFAADPQLSGKPSMQKAEIVEGESNQFDSTDFTYLQSNCGSYWKKSRTRKLQGHTRHNSILQSIHCVDPKSNISIEKKKTPLHQKYRGKIRIETDNGASIREVFDIDNSKHLLGKLKRGDERYFLKKKKLSPPPVSLNDIDDECVAVFRYMIALEDGDTTNNFLEKDDEGRLIGWISDRSRLKNEPYKILKEL